MNRQRFFRLLTASLSAVSLAVFSISTVFSASAPTFIPLTIVESSGIARTNLAVTATISNTNLQAYNYLSATALDSAVTPHGAAPGNCATAILLCAHMVVNDRLIFWVPSLGANSAVVEDYQLGWSPPLTALSIMPGTGGYATTIDAAALEPGAGEWAITVDGYWDTSVRSFGAGLPVYKPGVLAFSVTTAGSVTGIVYDVGTNTTAVPTGDVIEGVWSAYAGAGCAQTTQYVCVATANDSTYFRVAPAVAEKTSTFSFPDPALASNASISSIQVRTDWWSGTSDIGNSYITPKMVLGSDTTTGATVGVFEQTTCCATNTQTLSRPGGGYWQASDLATLRVGITAIGDGTASSAVDYLEMTVNYALPAATVTKAVSTGEHAVVLGTDATNLYITVDGGAQTTTPKAAVQGTTANWLWLGSVVMPYASEIDVTISGVSQANYEPVTMISGGTLPDLSGQAHPGTFTYGSNPAGVAVTLGSITPTTAAAFSGSITEPQFEGITGVSSTPPGGAAAFYPSATTQNPFLNVILVGASTIGAPASLLYLLVGFGGTMLLGFLVWWGTRSPMVCALAMAVCIVVGGLSQVIAWIWIIPFVILSLAFLVVYYRT